MMEKNRTRPVFEGKPSGTKWAAPVLAINPVTGEAFFADSLALTRGPSGYTYFNTGHKSVQTLPIVDRWQISR